MTFKKSLLSGLFSMFSQYVHIKTLFYSHNLYIKLTWETVAQAVLPQSHRHHILAEVQKLKRLRDDSAVECLLFFNRLEFPASTSSGSQPRVTPAPEVLMPSSGLHLHKHLHTHHTYHTYIHTHPFFQRNTSLLLVRKASLKQHAPALSLGPGLTKQQTATLVLWQKSFSWLLVYSRKRSQEYQPQRLK